MQIQHEFLNNLSDILCEVDFVRKGKKELLANIPCVFDIESSSFYENDEKKACMYAWVFGINGKCIRGRTWKEFIEVINKVIDYYKLDLNKRLVIYVHNLSFEFQWFKHLFNWHKVFSLDTRQPIYAITNDGIEFRCSYLLSGLSLAKIGSNLLKYKVQKMVGDLDYNLIRHCETPLNDLEWRYILNDGLVVMAYIQEEIERLGTIKDLPLTKTGYVRNLCRETCLKGDSRFEYSKTIKRMTMTVDDYQQCKKVFAGGFTHANPNYVGKTIKNVDSFDFTSSYPAVMLSEKFPASKAFYHKVTSSEDFIEKLKLYCCMFECTFYNIKAKVNYEHYISKSKCQFVENYTLDNGRIVEASELTINITEQDFFIIADFYTWDYIDIGNFKYFFKDYLPKDLILTVLNLYRDKTILKGVEGKEAEYMVSKGMINSVYGMSVTDPCKDEIIFDTEWKVEPSDINLLIEKYNKSSSRFLFYPWGIWITAYARRNLFTGIKEFGSDYIYSDTDSLKVINTDKHSEYFKNYNKEIQNKISKCLKNYNIPIKLSKPKTKYGEEKLLGIWDFEGTYDLFKTLGAKRYMYYHNKKLSITISGVNKSNGVEYLFYKYKTVNNIFKNFNDELCFPASYEDNKNASGKLCHTYLDDYMYGTVIDYLGKSYNYVEYSAIHLEPTSYNLSLDDNFKNYLLTLNSHLLK